MIILLILQIVLLLCFLFWCLENKSLIEYIKKYGSLYNEKHTPTVGATPFIGEYAYKDIWNYGTDIKTGKIRYNILWVPFQKSDIVEEHLGELKIKNRVQFKSAISYDDGSPTTTVSFSAQEQTKWINKKDIFYYTDVYKLLKTEIEERLNDK